MKIDNEELFPGMHDDEEFVPYDELAMALEKLYISHKKKN